jgi:hypothetical protein
VGLTTLSITQVGSFLETAPQQVHPFPNAAPSVSRSGGRVQRNSRILTLTAEKGSQNLAANRRPSGIPNTKRNKTVKKYFTKLYQQTPKCLIQTLPPTKLTNLQRNMTAEMIGDCFTQVTDPNDLVLLNLAAKKSTLKYFVALIHGKGPDSYNTRFLRKLLASWIFCSQKLKTLQ